MNGYSNNDVSKKTHITASFDMTSPNYFANIMQQRFNTRPKRFRQVYNRGVAASKTGHRPGTTPQQSGHARVNAFIVKKKKGGLNHDKDLA